MSDPAPDDSCAAAKYSALKENEVETQDEALETGNDGAFPINFDLDQTMSSEHQNATCDNDDSKEIQTKKVKFRSARENLRKINCLMKSKVDVFGKVPMFRGKKRSEKQDKEAKRLSLTEESKQDIKRVSLDSTSEYMDKFGSENGATVKILQDVSGAEDTVAGDNSALIEFDGEINFNTSDQSEVAKHMAIDYQIVQDSWCANKESALSTKFSTVIPQANELINSQTETGSIEQSEFYNDSVVLCHPEASPQNKKYFTGSQNSNSIAEDVSSTSETSSPKWADTIVSKTSSIAASSNRGWQEGAGPAVLVDFSKPLPNMEKGDENTSDYNRFSFRNIAKEAGQHHEDQPEIQTYEGDHNFQSEIQEECFDDPYCSDGDSYTDNEDFWGSEFDNSSYQDDVLSEIGLNDRGETPDKPLPPKPEKKAFFSRGKSITNEPKVTDDQSATCLSVNINSQKHPAPVMPPQPPGLTQNQIKRRMVIDSIVNSERSYLESLERLVTDYEKTVLEYISQPKSYARLVFLKMKEIIFHHKMFQIELAECVKVWDQNEKIGDIFTGSFSKTMLISSYSTYVNSFAAAMDEIRSLQRRRQAFQDFLLKQEKISCSRLSIFGLMVKPVQRFPQFIMFLQDLIKFTPHNHDDRMALQLALTELENVAYRLNERKRQSEQKFQARHIVQQLIKQKVQHVIDLRNLDMDPTRRLIRNDSIEQVLQQGETENVKCKDRRLILMNDHVLCVKVIQKEQSGYTVERYALRWMAKLKDLELKDTALPDRKSGFSHDSRNINVYHLSDGEQDDPFHVLTDLHEMLHDSILIKQINELVSQLKRSYAGHGLRDGLIQEIGTDLQHMVQIKEEQLRLVSNCSIILQDNSRSDKPHYVLQTQRNATKQDWCIDFLIAKLALDKSNSLGWDGTSGSDGSDFDVIPAYFIKHVPVDVPKKYTQIKCAVSIHLSAKKSVSSLGSQHLWVCSSTPVCGQVSILAIHNSRPALIESFRACDSDIMAVELVPGCGKVTKAGNFTFAEDTVWMAASHSGILIFPLASEDGVHRRPLASIPTPLLTVSMKFLDEKLLCGSQVGVVTIYCRQQDGGWNISQPVTLSFGSTCVKLHFSHEDHIWLSCGNKLCQLEVTSLQTQVTSVLNGNQEAQIDQVVKSGVGIWASFHGDSVIKLFHLETMEILQEISVGNFVSRIRAEKSWAMSIASEKLTVTCLTVSRGLLWIGTSLGVVLTVPLPRLSDGVPLYRGSPKLSLHAHKGPVRFIILMQCSSNVQEIRKSNSLSAPNEATQNLLNRQKQTLNAQTCRTEDEDDGTKSLDGDEIAISESAEHMKNVSRNSVPIISNVSEQETAEVSKVNSEVNISDERKQIFTDRNEKWPELDAGTVELRNKGKSSVVDRRSKTLNFYSDITRESVIKSRNYSRSYLDLSSVDLCEVKVLYKSLLEDDPDTIEYGEVESSDLSSGMGCKWSSESSLLEKLSRLNETIPLGLNVPPQVHNQRDSAREGQSEILTTAVPTPDRNSSLTPTSVPSPVINSQDASHVRTDTNYEESKTTGLAHKISSNAVVVVSGGDGYCDLDMSRREVKMDDACVLLWIHKFY